MYCILPITGTGIARSKQEFDFKRFIHATITNSRAYHWAGLGFAILIQSFGYSNVGTFRL